MNTPVLKIFSAVIPTIFDSFLRVNRFFVRIFYFALRFGKGL